MSPAPLRQVPESGELPADGPQTFAEALQWLDEAEDVRIGLQRQNAGLLLRIANMKRDNEALARKKPHWPVAKRLHDYWREKCKHPRSAFSAECFDLAEPYIDRDGEDLCRRAIDGAAFDPFITRRKNGTPKRHDGWDLIYRSRAKFEEFCNRAPTDA